MIIICEPHCKNLTHEKVNSGFIYGLSLAYPNDQIRFYAHPTHITAIKRILNHDQIKIDRIEFFPIHFFDHTTLAGLVSYIFIFKRLFSTTLKLGTNKIFFLSYSSTSLWIIKKLKRNKNFSDLKFTSVLHGSFEGIADDVQNISKIDMPYKSLKQRSFAEKIKKTKWFEIPFKVVAALARISLSKLQQVLARLNLWSRFYHKYFVENELLFSNQSKDFNYMALSPHVVVNAAKYLDLKSFNMHSVVLPTVFASPTPQPINTFAKFATFGFGNALMLQNIAIKLAQKEIKNQYEIRIIGMDSRGTEDNPHVTCVSNGKLLDRSEMEKQALDIDLFLILYDKSRYRLSCSGSILESLSYLKPILHFDNDCINSFNRKEAPIGIRCDSLDSFVDKMVDIIENYEQYRKDFELYRTNILKKRNECSIENSVEALRAGFTFS